MSMCFNKICHAIWYLLSNLVYYPLFQAYSTQADSPIHLNYEYSVPEDKVDALDMEPVYKSEKYVWEKQGWTKCTRTCGNGEWN